jgi:hypothetical protein
MRLPLYSWLLGLAIAGCAVSGPSVSPPSQPAARLALQPEYRVFYDALADYGDWVLIEPWGYVFRPRVDFGVWRPYSNGFWAASDLYGWVWVSSESFGWATEHYGRWLWDDYQGWVWLPGRDWAPAWVAWRANDDWVAWAPLSPNDTPDFGATLPGGAFVFAPLRSLGTTNVSSQTVTAVKAGDAARAVRPVSTLVERNGVRFNPGPPIGEVERAAGGPVARVRIEDVIGNRAPEPARPSATASPAPDSLPSPRALRDAGDQAARDARRFTGQSAPAPPRVPIVRAFGRGDAPATPPRSKPAPASTPADTTRR